MKPTFNPKITQADFPKAGEAFSQKFIQNFSSFIGQTFQLFSGQQTFGDNFNGAVQIINMAHGIPQLVASPLRNGAAPSGVVVLACDTQANPSISMTTSATVNGHLTVAPAGYVFLTAIYPVVPQIQTISRLRSNASSLTTNVAVNVCTTTSMTLGPGDWRLQAAVGFNGSTATTWSRFQASICKTNGGFSALDTIELPTNGEMRLIQDNGNGAWSANGAESSLIFPTYDYQVPVGSTGQLFLVSLAIFTGTANTWGWMQAALAGPASGTTANVTLFLVGG